MAQLPFQILEGFLGYVDDPDLKNGLVLALRAGRDNLLCDCPRCKSELLPYGTSAYLDRLVNADNTPRTFTAAGWKTKNAARRHAYNRLLGVYDLPLIMKAEYEVFQVRPSYSRKTLPRLSVLKIGECGVAVEERLACTAVNQL